MKRTLLAIVALSLGLQHAAAQANDSTAFRAYLYNNTYQVVMHIDLCGQGVQVPGQELFGPLPGYLQKERNSFCWIIIDAEVTAPGKARLTMVNDYGSDDLLAELQQTSDTTYVLRHLAGSALKLPADGKWQKMPRTIELKRKK